MEKSIKVSLRLGSAALLSLQVLVLSPTNVLIGIAALLVAAGLALSAAIQSRD